MGTLYYHVGSVLFLEWFTCGDEAPTWSRVPTFCCLKLNGVQEMRLILVVHLVSYPNWLVLLMQRIQRKKVTNLSCGKKQTVGWFSFCDSDTDDYSIIYHS